jgi:hypothetical protein
MRVRALLAERAHVVADLANVEQGVKDMQILLARGAIARDRAEAVLAQCAEELKRLNERLAHIDESLPLLKAL